jgi:hypothetical protein
MAQIVLGNQSFPAAGDTLSYALDTAPEISLSPPGENQIWDYSNLENTFESEEIYLDASAGMASDSFPNADLVLIVGENNERYFTVEENCIEEISLIGNNIISDFLMVSPKYQDPPKVRRAPISYGDIFSDDIRFGIALDSEEIPDTLLELLPFTPDSVRISFNSTVNDTVDSWGTLHLPGESFEALRIKSNTTIEFILELKLFIWIPINLSQIEGVDSLLNTLPQNTYRFVGNDAKEILATINMDADEQILSVQYKNSPITSGNENFEILNQIKIFPNPAFDKITIFLENQASISQIRILNIHGKEYLNDHLLYKSNIDLNISSFPAGLYFIQYFDQNSEYIGVSRFLKQ